MSEETVQSRYVKLTKDQAPLEEIRPGELNQPVQVPQLAIHKCNECGQPLPESYEPPANEPWITGIFGCTEDKETWYLKVIFDVCVPRERENSDLTFSSLEGDTENLSHLGLNLVLLHGYMTPAEEMNHNGSWTGLFCPCVLFGRNVESLKEDIHWTWPCVCHAICVEGGMALAAATAIFHGIDPRTSFLFCEGLLFAWWMCGIYTGLFRQSLQKKYHLKNSPCDPCMVHCCLHWCALCQEHREMKGHLSDDVVMPMTIVNPPPVQEMNASENQESSSSSANGNEHTNLEMQAL
ncbi:hypothetical protein HHK36_028010 [Tetracentron sinense]|uniref:Cell number regulator 6 n=1 Tax=Tetracentron sinense TaxID=13715 RepID=A0A834YF11_TETSI|nr:hypothetical protein HHK36_028010 [Tetracentron sinense]